ncbi:MAG TPA: hypothetical protein VFX96_15875, partial [Pyrinomonadaceae bacterium]|nr:hypothetical protein [Pyrinomonadaceae bacterium]
MSDYLSQLARASGLSVGRPDASSRAASEAAPTHDAGSATRDASARSHANAESQHFEQVAFVEPSRGESLFEGVDERAQRARASHERADETEGSAGHYARRVGDDARHSSREDATAARERDGAAGLEHDAEARRARPATEEGVVTFVSPVESGRDSSTRGAPSRESLRDSAARETSAGRRGAAV